MATRRDLIRSALAGTALAMPAIFPRGLRAAEFTYKYANNSPATWPMNLRAQKAAAQIREETGGRLSIAIFPNNQLGSDTDMLSQLRSGAIEFFTLSGLILATLVPVASISGVGFAFKDYGQVWRAMDGELGDHVRAGIAKAGLIAMPKMLDNGYRHATTSTIPLHGPEDVRGLKMRVQVSPLSMALWTAFGAAPAGINWSEVYSALQTHIVDGQENPLSIIESSRIYEVQKFCSLTGHAWDGFHFLANRRAWQALPDDVRAIAARNFEALALAQRADMLVANQASRTSLEKLGLVFNDVDREQFRAVLVKAGFYEEWRKRYGQEAWGMLERVSGSFGVSKPELGRLAGKTAIVTGAAGGIGRATVAQFCRDGAWVLATDADAAGLQSAHEAVRAELPDAEIYTLATDIAGEDAAEAIAGAARTQFGGLDVLVNLTGMRLYQPLSEADAESWDRILRVNLLSYAHLTRATLPMLRASGTGAVVNVSSTHAAVPRAGMGQYDVTKAGIVSMTRTLAFEEARHGIRVNAVCPGLTLTPFHRRRAKDAGRTQDDLDAEGRSGCLLGRWAAPEEIAGPIAWLASAEASYITAAVLMVDGGRLMTNPAEG